MSTPSILSVAAYRRATALRDLTDPGQGPHALQLLVADVTRVLTQQWGAGLVVHRSNPIVPVEDNYDRLHYPADGAARDARYTRYVSDALLLRTHTSAMIPPLLRRLSGAREPVTDVLLACPGLVYRRDCIDRLHTGEPHQLDLWRIRPGAALGSSDLQAMISAVAGALLPGAPHRTLATQHPYTVGGRQIEILAAGEWVEIGECGVALPAVLADAGLDPARVSGLAMGLGLDRILMLRKGIDDIRLLRSSDPRVAEQMLDLSPYRPVSDQPAIRRDLSIAVASETTAEELGDRVRTSLGEDATSVEAITVVAETPYEALPPAAHERMGMRSGQKNVLLSIVLRDLERTLTSAEANDLRDRIYAAVHQGARKEWAAGPPTP